MSRIRFLFVLTLLLELVVDGAYAQAPATSAPEHPGKHLTAALQFENSLESSVGQREASVVGKKAFQPSPFGQGLLVSEGTWLKLPLDSQTFHGDEGTLMLWFKPGHDSHTLGPDGLGVFRRIFSIGNSLSLHKDQFNRLVFSIGTKQVLTSEVTWKPGLWYHVAATWKRVGQEMDMSLYFDGDPYRSMLGPGRGLLDEEFRPENLNIASFGTKSLYLGAVIDEVGLFDQALDRETIRTIFGNRTSLQELRAGKPMEYFPALVNLAKGKPVTGQVPQQSRWFPYRSVVDGEPLGSRYARANAKEAIAAGLPVWLQVDLQEVTPINTIRLWNHTGGKMVDVKVAVSATGKFAGEEFVVHDNQRDGAYDDSRDGRRFVFPTQHARYIRCWNAGLSKDPKHPRYGTIRWRELMVFHDKLKEK